MTRFPVDGSGRLGSTAEHPTATLPASVVNAVSRVFDIRDYGAKIDGATDDSAALIAAIAAAAVRGGDVYVAPGTGPCIVLSQLVIPNENPGSSFPRQKKIRIFGSGSYASGQGGGGLLVDGGSRLDLRYAGGGGAKILTLGIGELEIDHLSLIDTAGDALPFIWTTGTSLKLHHLYAQGSKAGVLADQDFAVLGGTTTVGDGTRNAPFQGYGTVIEQVAMQQMRRLALGQVYANACTIRDCWIGHLCGTGLAGGAAIEFNGGAASGNSVAGNVIASNQIELTGGYVYGIKLAYAINNFISGNSCYDPDIGVSLAAVRFDDYAEYNLLFAGFSDDSHIATHTESATGAAGTNMVFSSHQGAPFLIPVDKALEIGGSNIALYYGGVVGGIGRLASNARHEMQSLGLGNTAAASVGVGAIAGKFPIYDQSANLIGYVPIYTSIT